MVVKMSKLRLVGLLKERNAIVRELMKMGVVEIAPIQFETSKGENGEEIEEATELAQFDNPSKRIAEIDDELKKISLAINFLKNAGDLPKSGKPSFTYDDFVDASTYKGAWDHVFDANRIGKNIADCYNKLNHLKSDLANLIPWEKYPFNFDFSGTKKSRIIKGTVPISASIENVENGVVEEFYSDKDVKFIYAFCYYKDVDILYEELRQKGFVTSNFSEKGNYNENMTAITKEIKNVESKIEKFKEDGKKEIANLPIISALYDYIFNMRKRRVVRKDFLNTEKTFIIGGYVPEKSAEQVEKILVAKFNLSMEIYEPEEGEETPVLLQNNSFVYPAELVTELYSLPKSTDIDPNPVMSIFFFVFFGLMVSDAGYGLVMAIACFVAMKKMKLTGLMDKLVKLIFVGGISTFVWGALFGGWFGDFFQQGFGVTWLKPIWFNPLDDPMRLLIWSFVFGAIHIMAGMGMKAYILIKEGHMWDAIFDIGSWYLVFIGIGILAFASQKIGTYVLIAGVLALILTQGRHEKNIFMKLAKGVFSLYDVTGYLSDILSYSRLLALGLATGVIASVVNTMGFLGGGFSSIGGTIVILFAFVVGHTFNIAINALGAYVHSSRLQYVEFFGKFYEGGGKAFDPLKVKLKYVGLK